MKKTLIVLITVWMTVMLIMSCDNNPANSNSETPSAAVGYTVTFNLDGGTGTGCGQQTIDSGKTATRPETDPKKTNAVFKYWSKDKTSEFNFDTAITENTTLYAVWKTEFQVGDTGPAGGIIFYVADTEQTSSYVDSNGTNQTFTWKYLEASMSNLTITNDDASTSDEIKYFGFYFTLTDSRLNLYTASVVTTSNDSGTGENAEIGQGRYNTTKLVNTMNSAYVSNRIDDIDEAETTDNYAAKLCVNYRGGGYSDWFLPSLNELKEMYNHKDQIGGTWNTNATGSASLQPAYWSSSENSGTNAWTVKFSDGTSYSAWRTSDYKSVRAIRAF